MIRSAIPALRPLKGYFDSIARLRASELQWTVFHNGIFLDYFAPKSLPSYFSRITLVVDIKNREAAIPGSGDVPVVFTYSFDVARCIVEALDLLEWEEEMFVIGDKLTWNEFVRTVETVLGTSSSSAGTMLAFRCPE